MSDPSFERYRQIKEIGEFYRDRTLADVYNEFNLSRSKARDWVVDYVKLVNHPTDQVPFESQRIGSRFYLEQYSIDEIIEEINSSEENIQTSIQEFVAATLAEQDQDIDLRSVTLSDGTQWSSSLTGPGSFDQARRQITQSIAPAVSRMSLVARDIMEDLRPALESLRKIAIRVHEAIEYGISNFESPRDYNSDEVKLNRFAQTAGIHFLDEVLENVEQEENHSLNPYRNRLVAGIQDFRDKQFYTPIFVFISVQDGLMHRLCQEDGVPTDDENRFGDPGYKWDTKRDTLARLYQNWYGVSTGDFMRNLKAFYAHRNAAMHGDPVAHFDENIATISLLFLAMTLDTTLNYGVS